MPYSAICEKGWGWVALLVMTLGGITCLVVGLIDEEIPCSILSLCKIMDYFFSLICVELTYVRFLMLYVDFGPLIMKCLYVW